MKTKVYGVLIVLLVISMSIYIYYNNYLSDDAILRNATTRRGYTLEMSKKSVDIEVFIKPEWIPFDSDKPNNINIKVTQCNSTNIILKQVLNRGNDIYFSFDASSKMNYRSGEFLYNAIFSEDGTYSINGGSRNLLVFNSSGEVIDVGQTGLGPEAEFSFGILPEQYNEIKNGFYVKYTGMILYKYSKK